MSSGYIPVTLKQRVFERARGMCEYCCSQAKYVIDPLVIDSAFTHRPAWSAVDIDGRSYPYGVANGAYTMPFNVSGHPAIVILIGQTQDGLPMGMQIVGKRWREMELLAIAQQIDQILDAFQHPPISQPKNMPTVLWCSHRTVG